MRHSPFQNRKLALNANDEPIEVEASNMAHGYNYKNDKERHEHARGLINIEYDLNTGIARPTVV
jgi:hypothetical protein